MSPGVLGTPVRAGKYLLGSISQFVRNAYANYGCEFCWARVAITHAMKRVRTVDLQFTRPTSPKATPYFATDLLSIRSVVCRKQSVLQINRMGFELWAT